MKPFGIAVIVTFCCSPAFADNFVGCSKEEAHIVDTAFRNAKALTLKAATTIGDTPEYARWFGEYSTANAENVRSNLKAVVGAIRSGSVTAQCNQRFEDGCDAGEYAWVYPNEAYLMHLCPPFFTLPQLTALEPGAQESNNGTQEGTIVHELSHFLRVAGTDDYCYSRSACAEMADTDTHRAIDNADSYQYFTEDVTYYARQRISGKPSQ
ncbi:lysine-specific metallo-endopeptidase family protein [Yoonia maritima]|uniref:Lysine-specific metallo-endopeptidase family protein n=1 Tax=Yoonia maritima TaxID=1435347 RepID=A0A2T0W143_9RHOB|nr:M35 family metallo-endopeptidase [Yoonia maritima]PRY78687.1 lysine-specific metallo-endopeptidase family protein [Yoonia maritima]